MFRHWLEPKFKLAIVLSGLALLGACTHPIEIAGQGDVVSASGERDCALENQPCSFVIVSSYQETYTPQARAGFVFSHWEGCGPAGLECSVDADASLVRQLWGLTVPASRAVFIEESVNEGPVVAGISASRTLCVSPCTVVFSAEGTIDENRSHSDTWQDLGYHFDFADSASGTYTTTGLSRSRQIGGPLAAHTFICPGTETCHYTVAVRAENPEGDYSDASLVVAVEPAEMRYSAASTMCISGAGDFTGCPPGAMQSTTLPTPTQYSGLRILLRRGETFNPICIDYSASNVLVEPYGDPAHGRPEITGISGIGVDRNCSDYIPNDALIGAIDGSTGYPQRWASNITFNGLRMGYVAMGMSYHHVGLHDIDMQYENEPSGGAVSLAQNTRACLNSASLSCSNIPYPVGAYLSRVHITQSDAEIAAQAAPLGVNIGAFNCPIINWLAVLESSARNSIEHNFRSEGTWRSFHGHNLMQGHHHRDDPANGVRQKITVRACGIAETDPQQAVYRHSALDDVDGPMTRYTLIADNIIGSTDDFGFGARVTLAPSNAPSVEVVSYGIVERNTFVEPEDESLATDDARLSGFSLACRDNVEATPGVRNGCIDAGQNAVPAQWYTSAALDDNVPPIPLPPGS